MTDAPAPDTTVEQQRARLRAWAERRAPGRAVTMTETHISILAFAGDRVWKLKKAVAFPFVDLSTRARRREQCEHEVTLNRRLARDVYLGVVPIEDPLGRTVDHVVEMVRMPDDRRLAARVAGDADAAPCVDCLADLLAGFHRAAPTGGAIDACATRDAVADLWERSFAELEPFTASFLAGDELTRIAALARAYLAGRGELFDARIAAGRARDGHGDLLADDIFCLDDGPRVLDCLEFDEHLRFGDVLADVAFLAMDLERLGRADLARRFLDRYRESTGDDWPASLEHLYIAYRAIVRAKVACLRGDDEQQRGAARALLSLARRHLEAGRVRVVLVGGAPGTGKTTLANRIGHELRIPVLHSDEIRKELAGRLPTTHEPAPVDSDIYTPEWHDRTYETIGRRARVHLRRGESVVLDASWSDTERRAAIAQLAADTVSEIVAFRCSVPPAVAAERATARAAAGTDASDVSGNLATILAARFADWPDATVIDTTAGPEVVAAAAITALAGPVRP